MQAFSRKEGNALSSCERVPMIIEHTRYDCEKKQKASLYFIYYSHLFIKLSLTKVFTFNNAVLHRYYKEIMFLIPTLIQYAEIVCPSKIIKKVF